jgi:hypothetical protein
LSNQSVRQSQRCPCRGFSARRERPYSLVLTAASGSVSLRRRPFRKQRAAQCRCAGTGAEGVGRAGGGTTKGAKS